MFVSWYWIAPRLMSFSREHDHITLTEIVAHRSEGGLRKAILWASSLIIVFSFIFYIAAQFQGAGNTFAATFNMSMSSSILLGAFIIMIYTLLGGFWAVSVTDALQGSLMAVAAIVLPIGALHAVGGIDGLITGLREVSTDAQLSFSAANAGLVAVGVIVGGLAIGLGTYGQPHLMARIMALRDEKAMRQARLITIVWYLVVFLGMWFVGLVGHVLYAGLENNEQIFFVMLDGLFPTVVSAVLLAAVLSAIMSTADSQLLSAGAAIAHDLGFGGDNTKRLLLVSRLTIVGLVAVSVLVAINLPDKIFSRVLFAWMALGAAFGPTLFARLSGFRVKPVGVLISIVLGFGLTVILSFFPNAPGDIAERLIPFCIASFILLIFKESRPVISK
jgi:Na+/proline symporter